MKQTLTTALLAVLLLLTACEAPILSPTEDSLPETEKNAESTESTTETESETESEAASEPPQETAAETEPETAPPVSGCRLRTFTVPAADNRNMCADLTGEITDDTVTLTISAPTDTYTLQNAHVTLETDAVSVSFSAEKDGTVDLTAADAHCTITDADGLTRIYKIVLAYAPYTIPVLSVTTSDGQEITDKETYITATVSIDTAGVDGWFLPDGFTALAPTEVQIRGRGNSTWSWEKKPYKLKFAEKTSVLGLTEAKKWILLANYADYSLMRNYVAFETAMVLSEELSPFSQIPVNLFVNGEYRGVYSIGEDHEVKDGRIDLEKDNGTADTTFLLEIGGKEDDDVMGRTAFSTELVRFCSIEYPEEKVLTQAQADFIIDYCRKADEAVKNLDGYEEYLDVDSLIDWFIANELFYNLESCFRRSCFLTKEPDGKLKLGPIWDFDLAMGNLYNDFGNYRNWACLSQEYDYIEDNWFCYLLKDEAFRARLKARWNEVKDDLLQTALTAVDQMGETLAPHAAYNFTRWDTLGRRALIAQPLGIAELKTYEDNVRHLRDFIENRWYWMDQNI